MGDDSGDGDVGRFLSRLQYLADVQNSSDAAELRELYGQTVGRFLREVCREVIGFCPADSDVRASPSLLVSRIKVMQDAWNSMRAISGVLRMDPDASSFMDIVRRVTSEHEDWVGMRAAMSDRATDATEPGPEPEVLVPVPVAMAMVLVRLANQVSPVAPGAERPCGMHLQPAGVLWDERVRMSGWLLRLATAVLGARDGTDARARITAALADLAGERSGGEGNG